MTNARRLALTWAVPLTLLFAAVTLNSPIARADPRTPVATLVFKHDRMAPAAQVYRDLHRRVRAHCGAGVSLTAALGGAVKACEKRMVDRVVAAIGRPDLLTIHTGQAGRENPAAG